MAPVYPRSSSVFCGKADGVPAPATRTASGLAAMTFNAWPTTDASVRWKRSCATIFKSSPAAAVNSFHQLSP
ncbi:hypothetical protein G6F68_021266 [Rhizopus microsporus]|nr:hypothetical protein G6F68_021266 [Rhizopus microsporus]